MILRSTGVNAMNITFQIGDIVIVSNNKQKGLRAFFAKAIKFFTQSNWTHTAVTAGNIGNTPLLFEADTHVLLDAASLTFDDVAYKVAVYRHKFLNEEQHKIIFDKLFDMLNDKTYGYLQVLYFIRRWFWTLPKVQKYLGWILDLLHKSRDPRNWNNWFINGTLCSELDWWALNLQEQFYNNDEIKNWLQLWNSNNFSPKDTEDTVQKFNNLYELIYTK